MKYRLYVTGKCNDTRSFQSNIGIGGVILNNNGNEISFSKKVGRGTCIEAHIYGLVHGISEILKYSDAENIDAYVSNMNIVNYFKGKEIEINSRTEILLSNLKNLIKTLRLDINFEYLEVNEYNYVRNLAEEALIQ